MGSGLSIASESAGSSSRQGDNRLHRDSSVKVLSESDDKLFDTHFTDEVTTRTTSRKQDPRKEFAHQQPHARSPTLAAPRSSGSRSDFPISPTPAAPRSQPHIARQLGSLVDNTSP
jgi:hypothetical protein